MKRLLKKINDILEREYELPLPKKRTGKQYYSKQPPGYTNPFKHQQELQEKHKLAAREQQIRELQRLREKQKAELALKEINKKKKTLPPSVPNKPAIAKNHPVTQPKKAKTFFDKKIVIKIDLPHFKKPSQPQSQTKTPSLPAKQALSSKPTVEVTPFDPTQLAYKEEHSEKPTLHSSRKKKQMVFAGIILLGTTIIGSAIMNIQSQPSKDVKAVTTQNAVVSPNPKTKAIEAIKKHNIDLPKDEVPELATVVDAAKLKDQDFFRDAKNGDKILMYRNTGKAFLYRPSTDEVLVQAPLKYQQQQELIATDSGNITTDVPQVETEY